jgi:hypothetical protein
MVGKEAAVKGAPTMRPIFIIGILLSLGCSDRNKPAPGEQVAKGPQKAEAVRTIHPLAGGEDCIEMYSACTETPKRTQCTSAPFNLRCGETGRVPVPDGERLRCECPTKAPSPTTPDKPKNITPPADAAPASKDAAVGAKPAEAVLRLTIEHKAAGYAFDDVPKTRVTLLEGDPEKPSRKTPVGESIGVCGAQDGGKGELLYVICWHAGMGREVYVQRRGDKVVVETRRVYEEDAKKDEDPLTVIREIAVPPNTRVEVKDLEK